MYINKKKINKFKNLNNLYVVADFDRTITDGNSNTSLAVLANSNIAPKEYIEERNKLYNYYRPIEIDPNIPFDEKYTLMEEWFKKHFELLVRYKTKESDYRDILIDSNLMYFRSGAKEFIEFLHKNNIPLIIISAGIGNIIENFLKINNCLYDNIHIISNKIIFNDGIATGVDNKIIHSLNKNETSLTQDILNKINNRKDVILLGDQIGDLLMVDKNTDKELLTIGFLADDTKDNLDIMNNSFDIVCNTNETYIDILNLLFER